jgi:ABC-2 type transport system permease protein
MKKIWAICEMELQRLMKKKQSYLLMFAMPLLFTFIFGSLIGGNSEDKMTILVVDQDKSALSESFIAQLEDENTLFDIQKSSVTKAKQMLESKEMPGAIFIEKDFQNKILANEKQAVTFHKIPEFTASSTITQLVSNKLNKIMLEVNASNTWSGYSGESWQVMYNKLESESKSAPLAITKVNIDEKKAAPEVNGMSARAAGFSIMFVMMMMMSVTGTILEARKEGVWYRMLTMPASRLEISAGYLLSFFLIGWIQFGVLMLATHFMFDVNWGNPLAIIVLVSALLLAVVGVGLLIAGMVKTVEQQSAIGNMLVIATCMISGVYWPLEIEPSFMQKLADFLPQTWALKGFADLLANGGGIVDILDNVGILLGFAVLFLLLGIRKVKFE